MIGKTGKNGNVRYRKWEIYCDEFVDVRAHRRMETGGRGRIMNGKVESMFSPDQLLAVTIVRKVTKARVTGVKITTQYRGVGGVKNGGKGFSYIVATVSDINGKNSYPGCINFYLTRRVVYGFAPNGNISNRYAMTNEYSSATMTTFMIATYNIKLWEKESDVAV